MVTLSLFHPCWNVGPPTEDSFTGVSNELKKYLIRRKEREVNDSPNCLQLRARASHFKLLQKLIAWNSADNIFTLDVSVSYFKKYDEIFSITLWGSWKHRMRFKKTINGFHISKTLLLMQTLLPSVFYIIHSNWSTWISFIIHINVHIWK